MELGHLIHSENNMINLCYPGSLPELPAGFADKYSKETSTSDDEAAFDSKEVLLGLHRQQRAATLALLDRIPESELGNEGPEPIRAYVPTVGATFLMQDAHWMMHAGQWAVIRRQLGRQPLF